MKTYRMFSPLQRLALLAAVTLALLATFYGTKAVLGTAIVQEEREIEDKIPKHLPIKIKIKNPDKVKNLKNENWLQDFEIEVENISKKPIYFLNLFLVLPEVKSPNGNRIAFPLRYGRIEFIDFNTTALPEDIPIRPGESYTFVMKEKQVRGWERFAAERKLPKSLPPKIQLLFAALSFGDGTGFDTLDGTPINIHEKKTSNASCVERNANTAAKVATSNQPPNFLAHLSFSGSGSSGRDQGQTFSHRWTRMNTDCQTF